MYIDLTMGPRLIAYCDELAVGRQNLAEKLGRKPHNNAPGDRATGLAWHQLGLRCEGACWSWLKPIKWINEPRINVHHLPDLEIADLRIDVKGKRLHEHDLIVQLDDPEDWAYLLVSAEAHPRYRVFGWLWGYEVRTFPVMELIAGRPAYVVKDKGKLRSPEELHQRVETARAGSHLCSVCGAYAQSTVDNGETWQCGKHALAKSLNQREE